MSVTMVSIVPDIRSLDSHSKGLIIAPDATQLNSTQLNWQLSWVESGRESDHTESGAMIRP